jgi:Leucine-rich repeat (LRR) protein
MISFETLPNIIIDRILFYAEQKSSVMLVLSKKIKYNYQRDIEANSKYYGNCSTALSKHRKFVKCKYVTVTDQELSLMINICSNLHTLDLSYCDKITDVGLKELAKLTNLHTLDLSYCDEITDVGVKELAKLTNLHTLDLSYCDKITDVGVRELAKLTNLHTLDLHQCNKITDFGLKELAKLTNLHTLDLSYCDKITDVGVRELTKFVIKLIRLPRGSYISHMRNY